MPISVSNSIIGDKSIMFEVNNGSAEKNLNQVTVIQISENINSHEKWKKREVV